MALALLHAVADVLANAPRSKQADAIRLLGGPLTALEKAAKLS